MAAKSNGTNRARTCDLMRVKHALFQLSYDPDTAKILTHLHCTLRISMEDEIYDQSVSGSR